MRKSLTELGLTKSEIKAYLALIEYGAMTAAEISNRAAVPYSKVYDVSGNLEKKGWIEADQSRPSKFFPKSPSTALDTLRMRLDSERQSLEEQVLQDLMPLYLKGGVKERPEIWIVRGEFNIISKVKETMSSCKEELMIALPAALNNVAYLLTPSLSGLSEKDVRVKVLADSGMREEDAITIKKWAVVRVRGQMFGGGVISDGREVVMLLGAGGGGDAPAAIWSDHVGLARFAKHYFEYIWNDSKAQEP